MRGTSQRIVLPFSSPAARETERGFELLAKAAERGEIIGAAYTVITPEMLTRQGWFGAANAHPALTYYGVQQLAQMLLWPDEEHSR
ncbi:hypothetical protein [Methyloversatilis sp.]|uniref:hypothetical protein n=1 Tax=Methyloversatilis sp. TaxID=2569862 RepID=UPI0027363B37|nr:hypothetical protein [Methyloversatilis sp.]MDP3579124.1 hypothetical protein [Methyloversatilis sp.]